MKQQIEKLIKLASDYHAFAMEANLPMTHTTIRGREIDTLMWSKDGDNISVYLADEGKTWSIGFGGSINIRNYSRSIEIPFDTTEEYLERIYKDVFDYLHSYLELIQLSKIKSEVTKIRQEKIEQLEQELNKLKQIT